ncbi:hypothetical protein ACP70R_008089 [Stipagrostis hirtigluma subsp. patula]
MALVKKGATVLSLALLMVMAMAMIFFSCAAAADYCHVIGQCNQKTCFQFCLKNNYTGNFQAYCAPGIGDIGCCCRVPRSGAGA